jgi:hypothetical protein
LISFLGELNDENTQSGELADGYFLSSGLQSCLRMVASFDILIFKSWDKIQREQISEAWVLVTREDRLSAWAYINP